MGHKVHPIGFRVGVIRNWDAKWYADKHYVNYLLEDMQVRKALRKMYPEAGISQIEIDRQANNVTLTVHTARPGILIGRGGQRVDEMRAGLEKLIGKKIQLNIREIQQPELDAYLVARSVAEQMERRVSYRRAMKQALQRTMQAGAQGMRIRCAGRLDGAEIARKVIMHEGRVPLHTIRADIDYGFTEAHTVMGRIGVKVWVYKGEILPSKEESEILQTSTATIGDTLMQSEKIAGTEQTESETATAVAEKTAKTVKRVARPKVQTAETPAVEEKPAKAPVKKTVRTPKPKTEAEAAPVAEEKPAKAPVKKAPRTEKPKTTKVETTTDQGDSDATT